MNKHSSWAKAYQRLGAAFFTVLLATPSYAARIETSVASHLTEVADVVVNAYGDPTQQSMVRTLVGVDGVTDTLSTTVSTDYLPADEATWLVDRPNSVLVAKSRNGAKVPDQKQAFQYVSDRPWRVASKSLIVNGGYRKSSYAYDDLGNLKEETLSGASDEAGTNLLSRLSFRVVEFDETNTYPKIRENALGHREQLQYDPVTGNLVRHTDPNGLVVANEYDAFGRLTKSVAPDGIEQQVQYLSCSGVTGCLDAQGYYVKTEWVDAAGNSAAPVQQVYLDRLEREVKVTKAGPTGETFVTSRKQYNAKGELLYDYLPYTDGQTATFNEYAYDARGRVTKHWDPLRRFIEWRYDRNQKVIINKKGFKKTEQYNVVNALAKVIENDGVVDIVTTYQHDANGALLVITDPKNNKFEYRYTGFGQKDWEKDPDLGVYTYSYNTLGDLSTISDGTNVTELKYDALGRLNERREPAYISTWQFDTALNGLGRLHKATTSTGYDRAYSYDGKGRPWREEVSVDGQLFAKEIGYDAFGRKENVTYPGGVGYKNVYTNGYLTKVVDAQSSANVYWQGVKWDAQEHLLEERLGVALDANGAEVNAGLTRKRTFFPEDGLLKSVVTCQGATCTVQNEAYTYDALGNLKSRTNYATNTVAEAFDYDALNRLTQVTAGTAKKAFRYDVLGNLTFSSDIGWMDYTGTKPHAVTAVRPGGFDVPTGAAPYSTWALISNSGISFPIPVTVTPKDSYYGGSIGTQYFRYDTRGNMLDGNGRSIEWTNFNMPSRIMKGSYVADYAYDADHIRVRMMAGGCEKIYLNPRIDEGGRYEYEKCGDTVKEVHTIYAGSQVVGEHLRTTQSGASVSASSGMRYFHMDHLGSVAAVTDVSGVVLERMSFDPWGRRRDPQSMGLTLTPKAHATTRGFTTHEMLDDLGFVHMNARLYDPMLGRFISPDPVMARIDSSQALNRYSYVENNPLSFTDPSGNAAEGGAAEVNAGNSGQSSSAAVSSGRLPNHAVQTRTSDRVIDDRIASDGGAARKGWWNTAINSFADYFIGIGKHIWRSAEAINGDPEAIAYFQELQYERYLTDTGDSGQLARNFQQDFRGGVAFVDDVRAGAPRLAGTLAANTSIGLAVRVGVRSAGAGRMEHEIPDDRANHIFRDAEGHLSDTPANRKLLQNVANDPATKLGQDKYGSMWSASTRRNGSQVWTQTRNGKIINGGVNMVPRTFNPQTGLSSPVKRIK